MANKSISKQGTEKQETVPPIIPYPEIEILRETKEDGTIVYHHPNSFKSGTDSEQEVDFKDPYDVFDDFLRRLKSFIDQMGDESYEKVGFVLEALIRDADMQLEEMFGFIHKTVGNIEVHVIGRNSWPYRTGRVVGVTVTPPKKDTDNEASDE